MPSPRCIPPAARRLACAGIALAAAACAPLSPKPAKTSEAPPVAAACPPALAALARCLAGQDSAGAYYLIAMPHQWNGHLVLHAHGGPALGAPRPERSAADLERWAIGLRKRLCSRLLTAN